MRTLRVLILLAAAVPCAPAAAQPRAGYEWKPNGSPDQVALYLDGRQVGAWSKSGRYYRPYHGNDRWGDVTACPVGEPGPDAAARPGADAIPPGGVMVDRLSPRERASIRGREVPTTELLQALGAAGKGAEVPDDSSAFRLSALGGTPNDRAQVERDLKTSPLLAPFKDALVFKSYPAEHWAVKDNGFVARPDAVTLYLQEPSGKVVWREDGYPGAERLAEGLRRVRPDYKPEADVGILGRARQSLEEWLLIGGLALAAALCLGAGLLVLAGLGVFLVFRARKK